MLLLSYTYTRQPTFIGGHSTDGENAAKARQVNALPPRDFDFCRCTEIKPDPLPDVLFEGLLGVENLPLHEDVMLILQRYEIRLWCAFTWSHCKVGASTLEILITTSAQISKWISRKAFIDLS